MVSGSTLRHFLVTALLGGVVLLCLSHTGSRLSRWAEGETWPRPLELPAYDWIGDRARDVGELGLRLDGLALERGSANELNGLLFRVQHALVPSVLVRSPRERSLIVAAPGAERPPAELVAEGWADAAAAPAAVGPADARDELRSLALVDRNRRLQERPDARVRYRPTGIGAFYLFLILLVPPVVAARRGWVPFGLTLIGTPCALGLAAAAGDLTTTAAPLTLLVHAGLCTLWIRCVTPLEGARPARGPAEPTGAGQPLGRAGFALAVATAALLGTALFVLFVGNTPEGGWDAQAMYNMRARFVLLAEPFAAPFADIEGYRELHPDYPPLIPFAVAGGWRLGDGLWPFAPLALQVELFLGAAVLVGAWANRTGGRIVALAGVSLFLVSPFWLERVAAQECDVPLASLFVAGIVAWRLGQASPSTYLARRGAFVAGALIGAGTLVKNEGALLALAWTFVVVLQAFRKPRIPVGRPSGLAAYLAGLLPPLLILGAFRWIAPVNDLVSAFDLGRASWARAETVGRAFGPLVWRPYEFKSVFALVALPALAALFVGPLRWWRRRRDGTVFEASLAAVLLIAGTGYVVAYLVTPYDLDWHLRTSAGRLLVQLYPVAVVLGLSAASRALQRSGPSVPATMEPSQSLR